MNLYRTLPKMDQLLEDERLQPLAETTPYNVYRDACRDALDGLRARIADGCTQEALQSAVDDLPNDVERRVRETLAPHLRKVINATGVVLHTNLGRAVLSQEAMQAVGEVAAGYSNLEYDLARGQRGSRYDHLIERVRRLTGAEDAMVVNNNAAAVLLALSTLARGKEVICSRGELIEIGGSFRVPAVMEESGARLREVGTTNKTHPADYRRALNENTGALLRVHTSNYRVIGFTESVQPEELVQIRDEWEQETGVRLPLIEDLGSGVLFDLSPYGFPKEPTVREAVASGMDVVTFSGDKLLGGPQAGIIVGKRECIEAMRKNQLTRALRVDKFTISALEYTMGCYLDEETLPERVPVIGMLLAQPEDLRERAQAFAERIRTELSLACAIIETESVVGGGSLPGHTLPSFAVAIEEKSSAAAWERCLRAASVPVIGRVQQDRFCLDLRTVAPHEEDIVVAGLRQAKETLCDI